MNTLSERLLTEAVYNDLGLEISRLQRELENKDSSSEDISPTEALVPHKSGSSFRRDLPTGGKDIAICSLADLPQKRARDCVSMDWNSEERELTQIPVPQSTSSMTCPILQFADLLLALLNKQQLLNHFLSLVCHFNGTCRQRDFPRLPFSAK